MPRLLGNFEEAAKVAASNGEDLTVYKQSAKKPSGADQALPRLPLRGSVDESDTQSESLAQKALGMAEECQSSIRFLRNQVGFF